MAAGACKSSAVSANPFDFAQPMFACAQRRRTSSVVSWSNAIVDQHFSGSFPHSGACALPPSTGASLGAGEEPDPFAWFASNRSWPDLAMEVLNQSKVVNGNSYHH